MCQLLGMNCAAPTDFSFSLKGFCRRGGDTDKHSHGFGCAIYEGRGLRCFHDTLPAAVSPIAELIQNYRIRTYNMMAHIRYATQGEVSLENVHPFTRELWGIQWSFAHNGECPKFSNVHSVKDTPLLGRQTRDDTSCFCYHPVGDTDSEAVFCAILNAIRAEFPAGLPTLSVLHDFLQCLCREIIHEHTDDTIFNFLLGCGQYTLFAYSWPGSRPGSKVWNGLHYIVREPPFSTATLLDVDYSIDFSEVTTPADRVAVITTKPLTQEPGWREMKRGELIMFDNGKPHRTAACCAQVELEGRGLFSKAFSSSPKISRSRSSSFNSTGTASSSVTSSSASPNNNHHTQQPVLPIPELSLNEAAIKESSEELQRALVECHGSLSTTQSVDAKSAAAAAAAILATTIQTAAKVMVTTDYLVHNSAVPPAPMIPFPLVVDAAAAVEQRDRQQQLQPAVSRAEVEM